MYQRHPINPNLSIYPYVTWNGFSLQEKKAPFIKEYLANIEHTLNRAVKDHPRTSAFRVDLYLPGGNVEPLGSHVMTRFIQSLKAQLLATEQRKLKSGARVFRSVLRYIWVKEFTALKGTHYHVLLLLNRDAYNSFGSYLAAEGNLAARIKKAWGSALNLSVDTVQSKGLVHFPENPVYLLDVRSDEFIDQYDSLFHRVSYFAKVETKNYGDGSHHFGCSQK